MLDNPTPYAGSFQELADARRVLKIVNPLRHAPVLPAEDRLELERIRAMAIRTIEAATAELIATLDVLDDPDAEDNGDAEAVGDEEDTAWPEWHSRGRHKDLPPRSPPHEDAEDDDAAEEDDGDSAVDDRPCDDINMDLEPEEGC